MDNNDKNKLEIELVKKDMEIVRELVNKLDPVIDKLQEGFFTVTKMLALHEQKLTSFDDKNKEQDMDLHRLDEDIRESRKDLNERIDALTRDVKDGEKRLMHEIRDLRNHITGKKDTEETKTVIVEEKKNIFSSVLNSKIIGWFIVGFLTLLGWVVNLTHH